MNRHDLFAEFGDVFFALAPAARDADDIVSLEDVEDLRQQLTRICDRVAMKVLEDSEFTSDDAVDDAMDLESEREGVGLD
jgi:hypothetical protein